MTLTFDDLRAGFNLSPHCCYPRSQVLQRQVILICVVFCVTALRQYVIHVLDLRFSVTSVFFGVIAVMVSLRLYNERRLQQIERFRLTL